MRSNAILNIENIVKYCFIWSILVSLYPCNNNHPNRVPIHKQCFDDLNNNGFDFTNGFKSSDVHSFNELKNLPIKIFEVNFYQDQYKWRHKIIPIEFSKNNSDRVIDLGIYKNQNVLVKKLNKFLGDHHKTFFF